MLRGPTGLRYRRKTQIIIIISVRGVFFMVTYNDQITLNNFKMRRLFIVALFLFQLTPECQCRLNMARMQKQLNNIENLFKATTDKLKFDMEQLQIDLGTEQRKTESLESKLNETKEELEALTSFHQQPGVPSNPTDERFDELQTYVDVSVGILKQAVGKEKIKLRKLHDQVYYTAVSNCTSMIDQQKQLMSKAMDTLTATVTDNSKRLEGLEDQLVGLTHRSGIPGEKGERGGKGEKGERGQIGMDGRPGEMGARGSQGMKGDQGSEGDKGDTGIQGEKGERGERGQMGMNGNPGEKGAQGSQGLQGTKGDKGDPGLLVGCSAPKLDVIIPSETEILLYAPGQQISGMTCETGYQLVGDSVLTCRGNDTWQGTASCEKILHDCLDILRTGHGSSSGVYTITLPASGNNLQVYCDMTADGGGWIVFQNRFDGRVDFFRNRTEYHNGFGDLQGEFWLGLRYIYELSTACTDVDLRIYLEKADGTKGFDIYHNFKLSPAPGYTLHLSHGSISWRMNQGSTGYNMVYNNGSDFYTHDHDTQSYSCATSGHGAWWYNPSCGLVNLNGEYVQPPGGRASPRDRGMFYYSFDTFHSLKAASMMLRCRAHAG